VAGRIHDRDPHPHRPPERAQRPRSDATRELTLRAADRSSADSRRAAFLRYFEGSTVGEGCGSSLRGAAYATSEVELWPTYLRTWDRGFDARGEQVWGATEGPYVFERVGR